MSGPTFKKYNTPNTTNSIRGRWGFDYQDLCCDRLAQLLDVCILDPVDGEILIYNATEECWENKPIPTPTDLCLNDLCDVCYLPPPAGPPLQGEFLVWNDVSMCWENTTVKICRQDLAGLIDYYRLADRVIIPGLPALDIPVVIQNPFRIPVANFTGDAGGTGGMNNYDVRGSAISTVIDLADPSLDPLWVHVGSINPPITTPAADTIEKNNDSPSIQVEPGECVKISFHCLTSPKLKAGVLDDGNLGMLFRLRADPASESNRYFQTLVNPNAGRFDYMWITECDSHSYSRNAVIVSDVTTTTTFYLEAILYQGIRFGTTNTTLNGINVQGLFEIEPFFQLIKEEIVLSY